MRSFINRDPFQEIERFFEDDCCLTPTILPIRKVSLPAVDLIEDKDKVTVEMALPGIDPKNVEIDIEDSVLTVSGQEEKEEEEKDKRVYRREIRKGAFKRSLNLPAKVKGQEAEANFKDGVLNIEIPKAEEAKSKKVEIKVK